MDYKKILLILVSIIVLLGCITTLPSEWSCKDVVPPDFNEEELVGTWQAVDYLDKDTIIIREDGYYKQILHKESESVDFKSDWQRWWVEYGNDGIPYLYLENMMLCIYEMGKTCHLGGESSWFDYCTGENIHSSGEGIFVVIYSSYSVDEPPSLHLGALLYDPDGSGIRYERNYP